MRTDNGKNNDTSFCNPPQPPIITKFPPCFAKYRGTSQRGNPGSVENLHILSRQIMPKFFDGLEIDYVHRIAVNRYATANWVYSVTRPSGFRFGGIYTMRKKDNTLHTPTIQGDINPSTMSSNVSILYYPFKFLRFEAKLQRASEDLPLLSQTTVELMRPSATITANLYNVSRDSGRSTLSFLRTISDHWSLGAEMLLEWTDPGSISADTALAARYALHNYSIAATASRRGIDVSYWQRLHKDIQMASQFAWNRGTEKAIGSVCYQWNFDDATVRGLFNSDMSIGFMYLRSLRYIPCELGISLLISLPTSRFIFGLKFNLNPSALRRDEQMLEFL